ncbi:hypothetical protein SASPL_123560 [Salvia splendens]|uniref:Uncharacterized protein n=1 Tax=Salvia splendens TaxID=180675 RepID=A0A8X8XL99_SALSN|nr:hypothetical protein SASPL_123560 [Salvia splendens]
MRGYEKDEYENWDEYEEDGEEQEEEEGCDDYYEEVHQPTQEELDYLAIRQKLKESIRKKMKKDAGTANSASRNKVNASRKDNYGSFFGPSQPVIAQRVIQESKSLLENPDLAARMCKTSQKVVVVREQTEDRKTSTPELTGGLSGGRICNDAVGDGGNSQHLMGAIGWSVVNVVVLVECEDVAVIIGGILTDLWW